MAKFEFYFKQIRNFLERNYTAVLLVVTSARPRIIFMSYHSADWEKIQFKVSKK